MVVLLLAFTLVLQNITPAVSIADIDTGYDYGAEPQQPDQPAEDISSVTGSGIIAEAAEDEIDRSMEYEYETNRFIIKYKNNSGGENLKRYLQSDIKSAGRVGNKPDKNMEVIILNEKVKPEDFISDIRTGKSSMGSVFEYHSDIEYIQPDYVFTNLSSDAYYDQQWGIYNPGIDTGEEPEDMEDVEPKASEITIATDLPLSLLDDPVHIPEEITDDNIPEDDGQFRMDANVPEAWLQTKGEGVVIAVLDTGIDITQEDLADNIYTNPFEIPGNYIDDDGNGYIDDTSGWDFVNNTNQVHNRENIHDEWHGTHIAGIIAAQDNNDIGITGVAPDAKILPLKVFQDGIAYTSDIINAIEYAERMGVKIVNCSWGSTENNPALKEAIDHSNMLFVCAAGNSSQNIDVYPIYPASYDNDNIISVAAMNEYGILTGFTNYGNYVDVAAPGEDIISTVPDNRYVTTSGTSMAAAFVTGEAALIQNMNKELSPANIRDRIITTADRLSSLTGKIYNGNKINCYNAVHNIVSDEIIQVRTEDNNTYPENNSGIPDGYHLYANGTWVTKANYPNYTSRLQAVTLNGKIYAGGGSGKEFYEYDPLTNTWLRKADMVEIRKNPLLGAVNGKIYALSGYNYGHVSTIEEYNPSTNKWSPIADSYVDRTGACVAVIDNIIYVMGGGYGNRVDAYNPATNTWTAKASMIAARYAAAATVLNGKIYVAGGLVPNSLDKNSSMEMYDPATDSWTMKANMSAPRYRFGLQAAGGKLYAMGGDSINIANTIEEYSPISNSWSSCPNMLIGRYDFASASINNSIYVIGGYSEFVTNTVHAYLPEIDDHGNNFTDSTPIPEETEAAGVINRAGDVDCFNFIPQQSGPYDIFTTGTMNSYGELYNSAGTLLSYNDNYDTDINFRITAQLQAGQVYYIKVRHSSSTSTGSYRLRVSKSIPTPANIRSSVNSASIVITWDPVPNITGYEIEVNGVVYNCGLSLSYTHNSPENNKAHTYRVRSKNSMNISPWSSRLFASTLGNPWQIAAGMPEEKAQFAVANLNGKIYVIGGYSDRSGTAAVYNTVYEYDIVTNTWRARANMNTARYGLSAAVVNGRIYAIGGHGASGIVTSVEEYDPAANKWTLKANMPTARYFAGASELNGKIYVAGGLNGSTYYNKVEVYDPAANTWTAKKSMNTQRYGLAVAAVNNKLYAIGGRNGAILNVVEEYDPVTDTWTTKANLPTARYGLGTEAIGNIIYAIGGLNSQYLDTVEVYSPDTNTWVTKDSKLIKAYMLDAAAVGGKLFVFGGYNNTYGCLSTVEVYSAEVISYEYGYDANNRLIEVRKNGQLIVRFTYDKNGNLITTQFIN